MSFHLGSFLLGAPVWGVVGALIFRNNVKWFGRAIAAGIAEWQKVQPLVSKL